MMIISGHQPAYLPWLGLIHKASLCDTFVFMDDVQFLSRDFNHRNRVITPQGKPIWLTVPIDHKNSASDKLKDIIINNEEHLPEKKRWPYKHWMTLKTTYTRAKHFKDYAPFFEDLYLGHTWHRLADLNLTILKQAFHWFDLSAQIVIASEMNFTEKKSDLILEHGKRLQADLIVTGQHGQEYIEMDEFDKNKIKVYFQNYQHPHYQSLIEQSGDFVPLAFVDLLFQYGPESRNICFANNITREELCRKYS